MKPTTVIFTIGGGRLANQLLNAAHLFAWCKEQNFALVNISFWTFSNSYPNTEGNTKPAETGLVGILYKIKSLSEKLSNDNKRRIYKILNLSLRSLSAISSHWLVVRTKDHTDKNATLESFDLTNPEFSRRSKESKIILMSGWQIRAWSLVDKYQQEIRNRFLPEQSVIAKGTELINDIRQNHDLLIALFIRKGDYRNWINGRFYFQNEQYKNWIDQITTNFPNKNVAFLISCEEKIDIEELGSGSNIYLSSGSANKGGTAFETLYELSCCDMVFSVPSTFSAWAAFTGNIPLIPLHEKEIDFNDKITGLSQAASHHLFKIAVN